MQVLAIWLAALVLRVRDVTLARSVGVIGSQMILYALVCLLVGAVLFRFADSLPIGVQWLLFAVYSAASLVLWVGIVKRVLRSNWWQAIGIYVAQSMAGAAGVMVLRLLVAQAFVVPSNAMAPSILGHRYLGVCPVCNGNVIVTALPDRFGRSRAGDRGICDRCWSFQTVEPDISARYTGDRFVVSMIEEPRRWDAVTYHPPGAPDQIYIHRLVGLPGERITIRGGALWINGQRAEVPPELSKLRYRANAHDEEIEDASWQLGGDEFFVLGDNTCASLDSRDVGPIRESALQGVAMATYWPPSRMRLLQTTTAAGPSQQ